MPKIYAKVVGIDSDGECVEVITDAELGRTNYGKNTGLFVEGLTIRTIDSEDHMIVNGREFWCTRTKGKGKKMPKMESKLEFFTQET